MRTMAFGLGLLTLLFSVSTTWPASKASLIPIDADALIEACLRPNRQGQMAGDSGRNRAATITLLRCLRGQLLEQAKALRDAYVKIDVRNGRDAAQVQEDHNRWYASVEQDMEMTLKRAVSKASSSSASSAEREVDRDLEFYRRRFEGFLRDYVAERNHYGL